MISNDKYTFNSNNIDLQEVTNNIVTNKSKKSLKNEDK